MTRTNPKCPATPDRTDTDTPLKGVQLSGCPASALSQGTCPDLFVARRGREIAGRGNRPADIFGASHAKKVRLTISPPSALALMARWGDDQSYPLSHPLLAARL